MKKQEIFPSKQVRKTRFPLSSCSGFTLIELLVVIAIISILTGLVGSNFIRSRVRARDAQRRSNLKDVQTALELYLNDHGRYPCRTITQVGNGRIIDLEWGNDKFDNASGGHPETIYMPILPGDPQMRDVQYHYEVNSDYTKYRVFAWLENEEDVERVAGGYSGKICSETDDEEENFCNYGVSSTNTTMTEGWAGAGGTCIN